MHSSLIAWIMRAIPFGTIIMYGALGETVTEKSGNVVLTADVHDVKALTYGFEDAAAKLKELGYTKVQVLGKDGFTPCAL